MQNVEKIISFLVSVRTVGRERMHHAFVHKLSVVTLN